MWVALHLGVGERTHGKLVFPGLLKKTSNRSIHMQEFWKHTDLGSNPSSLLASCGTWDKLLHLFEPQYPAHKATGGSNELVHLKHFAPSLAPSRCSLNGNR